MGRRPGVRTFRSPRGCFTLTHATCRWENHLDQGEQLGYFNDAFQCLKKGREFRRGFGRNEDSSHKLQDVLGFIHTDIACSCKEGKIYFASVEKGGSAAWLPRPESPKSTGEPAPTDGEDLRVKRLHHLSASAHPWTSGTSGEVARQQNPPSRQTQNIFSLPYRSMQCRWG